MRISDWSSDVCSSDLPSFRRSLALGNVAKGRSTEQVGLLPDALHRGNVARFADAMAGHARSPQKAKAVRSEEHTSELQSLMRISYAVFCLKKKNKKYIIHES